MYSCYVETKTIPKPDGNKPFYSIREIALNGYFGFTNRHKVDAIINHDPTFKEVYSEGEGTGKRYYITPELIIKYQIEHDLS